LDFFVTTSAVRTHKKTNEEMKMVRRGVFALAVFVLGILGATLFLPQPAMAQEGGGLSRSEISVLGTGLFQRDTTGNGITQRTTESGGFLGGYRYHLNRVFAVEANYGYSRNSQIFAAGGFNSRVQTNIHEVMGDLVVTSPVSIFRVKPYALAGAGGLIFDPTNAVRVAGAGTEAKAAFVYGGGLDLRLLPHISLRGEYRGFVFHAPSFGVAGFNTGNVTHLAQPAVGLVIRL
jgi:opacity protein-like surface antigen